MPAPSPPGLKSSIEYFAMSVGIGRTLYGPPSPLVLLDHRYQNIEPFTILKLVSCSDTNGFYSPMVRTTLLSGRVLLGESLSCCLTISSYFSTVVTSLFGTMCTTL